MPQWQPHLLLVFACLDQRRWHGYVLQFMQWARSLILDPPKVPVKVLIIFLYTGIFFDALMDSLALLCADHLEARSSKLKYGLLKFILAGTKGNVYGIQSGVCCLEFSVNYPLLCSYIFPPGSHSLFVFRSACYMWLDDDGSSLPSFFS